MLKFESKRKQFGLQISMEYSVKPKSSCLFFLRSIFLLFSLLHMKAMIGSLLFILASCGKDTSSLDYKVNQSMTLDPNTKVTFADVKSNILQPYCLSCHADVSTETGLKKWISPGDPEASSFFTDVKNGSMPKDQNPLDLNKVEMIRLYIEQMVVQAPSPSPVPAPVPSPATGITYEEVKTKVLTPYRCLNCHSVGTEAKLAKWINTTSPAQSLFYTTIKDGSMPKGGPRAGTNIQQFVLQYVTDFANR